MCTQNLCAGHFENVVIDNNQVSTFPHFGRTRDIFLVQNESGVHRVVGDRGVQAYGFIVVREPVAIVGIHPPILSAMAS